MVFLFWSWAYVLTRCMTDVWAFAGFGGRHRRRFRREVSSRNSSRRVVIRVIVGGETVSGNLEHRINNLKRIDCDLQIATPLRHQGSFFCFMTVWSVRAIPYPDLSSVHCVTLTDLILSPSYQNALFHHETIWPTPPSPIFLSQPSRVESTRHRKKSNSTQTWFLIEIDGLFLFSRTRRRRQLHIAFWPLMYFPGLVD